MKTLILLAAMASTPSVSQEQTWHVDAEWNASLAIFGGVGATGALKPPTETQLRVHLGALVLTLPEFGLGAANAGQGWHVNDRALLLGGQYYFRPARGGLYVGLDALVQQRIFSRDGVDGTSSVLQYIVAGAVGYEWFPIDSIGLYVSPNLTVAVRLAETGEPKLGDATFTEGRVLPLPGVNIGWQF